LSLPSRFGLVTLHRPANVDNNAQLLEILSALEVIMREVPLIWPMHPRTRGRIESNGIALPAGLRTIDPLGYLDFLCLQASSAVVLTDSGGVQEETTVLGVPCLTLRENTERPVTIKYGTNHLAGTRRESILRAWENSKTRRENIQPPLWDGDAGGRCREILRRFFLPG
jgi:UDP-N-acetylglucosamine 2-epimerase (non-hydrolysing)